MTKNNDIAKIIKQFLPELREKSGLSKQQFKVLHTLKQCRSAEMGGSIVACKDCGSIHYVMHSCRNRHCPKCQGIEREIWLEARKSELLPVKYFHVVFTVPHELLELFRFNKQEMYNLLFRHAWKTLSTFGNDPKWLGAQLGALAILHTWDQQMKYHPHIHFLVPAGGLTKKGTWIASKTNGDFLFDVKMISEVFRYSFVKELRQLKEKGKLKKSVPKTLYNKDWVVYAKQAFGSPEQVLEYLGRYTHRVAISNARIKKVTNTEVTFNWCDRKNAYITKEQKLSGIKFLERFVQHILPQQFTRIRHYGFLSPKCKKNALDNIRLHLQVKEVILVIRSRKEILEEKWGERSVFYCRECGGELHLLETLKPQRAPPKAICPTNR
jgi:ribosomal protein L19E